MDGIIWIILMLSIKIGTKEHKLALAASNKQSQAIGRETTQIIKNTKAQIRNNKVQAQATTG